MTAVVTRFKAGQHYGELGATVLDCTIPRKIHNKPYVVALLLRHEPEWQATPFVVVHLIFSDENGWTLYDDPLYASDLETALRRYVANGGPAGVVGRKW